MCEHRSVMQILSEPWQVTHICFSKPNSTGLCAVESVLFLCLEIARKGLKERSGPGWTAGHWSVTRADGRTQTNWVSRFKLSGNVSLVGVFGCCLSLVPEVSLPSWRLCPNFRCWLAAGLVHSKLWLHSRQKAASDFGRSGAKDVHCKVFDQSFLLEHLPAQVNWSRTGLGQTGGWGGSFHFPILQ